MYMWHARNSHQNGARKTFCAAAEGLAEQVKEGHPVGAFIEGIGHEHLVKPADRASPVMIQEIYKHSKACQGCHGSICGIRCI